MQVRAVQVNLLKILTPLIEAPMLLVIKWSLSFNPTKDRCPSLLITDLSNQRVFAFPIPVKQHMSLMLCVTSLIKPYIYTE
jgi:hypothetical protein